MSNPQQIVGINTINERLTKFVASYISEVETILHTYNLILKGESDDETIKKLSKMSPETSGEFFGSTAGRYLLICSSDIGTEIGKVAGKKFAMWVCEKRYLSKIKQIKDLIANFLQDEAKFRQDLVSTAVNIFRSYEKQFSHVTTDLGPEKAMLLLAKDAARRSINYYKSNAFSSNTLVDSVFEGKSVKLWGLPIKVRGFKVKCNLNTPNETWKTDSLYDKVGLLKEDPKGNSVELYVKANGKSKPDKYGFRYFLKSENWTDIKNNYSSYNSKKAKKHANYTLILTPEIAVEKCRSLLENINKNDSNLLEDRIKSMMTEAAQDIAEQLNTLKTKRKNKGDCYKILNVVDEWLKKFSESTDVAQEIHCSVRKMSLKLDSQLTVTMQRLIEIEESIDDVSLKEKNETLWFNVRDPIHLFTGRAEDLMELHSMMQRNSEMVSIISQTTCISGPSGIGKSELARKYVQQFAEYYENNVVWINADNRESLVEWFLRLAQNQLCISSKNADGGEKDIKTVVYDTYKYVSKGKCLFIFDNVKEWIDIIDFLPRSLPPKSHWPCILITTRNHNWRKGIEVQQLRALNVEDAVTLIQKGLRIEDENQVENINKLVKELNCLPQAIIQAIHYIGDQKFLGEYNIEDYLDDYKNLLISL